MSDDKQIATGIGRRRVLKAVGAGALTIGGIGTASAAPGNGNGPPTDDTGPGNGNGGSNRPPGSGPTRETGGSGLVVSQTEILEADLPEKGDPFSFKEMVDSSVQWYSGCDSVGSKAKPNTYQGYTVTGLEEYGISTVYIVDKRPVQLGDYLVAEASFCGVNLPGTDDISDDDYYVGYVYKFGWEPGEEGEEG